MNKVLQILQEHCRSKKFILCLLSLILTCLIFTIPTFLGHLLLSESNFVLLVLGILSAYVSGNVVASHKSFVQEPKQMSDDDISAKKAAGEEKL